jgi:signal transduction histidine kinase/CheY-like chemotaxis protein
VEGEVEVTAYRDLSIKRKLHVIILLTAGAALALASAVFVSYDLITSRRSLVRDRSTLAQIIGSNCTAALSFNDRRSAKDVLSSLSATPHIVSACIYDEDGRVFVQYQRGRAGSGISAPQLQKDGAHFGPNRLELFSGIMLDGQRIGTVYVQSDLGAIYARLKLDFGLIALIMLASLGAAYALASKLQRVISGPILHLAETAQIVSVEKNYSVRAVKQNRDELGLLIEGFNEMLSQIQHRDQKLERHREHLEEEVAVRTEEITKLNEHLEQRVAKRTAQLAAVNETLEQRNLEVERMTRLKSQFLASMSHELRTPLNSIIGFADLLQDGTSGPINEKQKKFVKHVQQAGRHLLDLINDILDLSKIEAGQLKLQPENFSAEGALPEVLSVIKPLAMKKHIEVRTELESGLILYADRVRFKQIIYNLLSNAIKFTSDGGQVNVESVKMGKFIRFSVTDTGIGIRPEDREAIFEEFRQVGQTTSGVTEGTGLGLAICKRLAAQQGGTIWVESEVRKGSRFSFTLPEGHAISQFTGAPSGAVSIHPARTQPLILVVDDEPGSRELLASHLAGENFRMEITSSGDEALVKARQLLPDVITLDLIMPGKGGWMILSELKANPTTAYIPVVVVSIVDDKSGALAMGAAECLVKPVSKEGLLEALLRQLPSSKTGLS